MAYPSDGGICFDLSALCGLCDSFSTGCIGKAVGMRSPTSDSQIEKGAVSTVHEGQSA